VLHFWKTEANKKYFEFQNTANLFHPWLCIPSRISTKKPTKITITKYQYVGKNGVHEKNKSRNGDEKKRAEIIFVCRNKIPQSIWLKRTNRNLKLNKILKKMLLTNRFSVWSVNRAPQLKGVVYVIDESWRFELLTPLLPSGNIQRSRLFFGLRTTVYNFLLNNEEHGLNYKRKHISKIIQWTIYSIICKERDLCKVWEKLFDCILAGLRLPVKKQYFQTFLLLYAQQAAGEGYLSINVDDNKLVD